MAAGVHVVRVPAKLGSLAKLNLLFGAVELPAGSRSSEGEGCCAGGRAARGEHEGEHAEGKDGAHDFSCQLSMNGAKRTSYGRIVSATRRGGDRCGPWVQNAGIVMVGACVLPQRIDLIVGHALARQYGTGR